MKKFWFALISVLALTSPVYAQDDASKDDVSKYIELLRADLRTSHTAIVTEALDLTEAQGTAFWPLYREYEKELSTLGDQRIALIKEYATNYESMTDKMAKDLGTRAFKLNEDRTALLKKYYAKAEKVIQPKLATRWAQVENAINALVDLQVAAELPLMK